jgi:hypothetical protein
MSKIRDMNLTDFIGSNNIAGIGDSWVGKEICNITGTFSLYGPEQVGKMSKKPRSYYS